MGEINNSNRSSLRSSPSSAPPHLKEDWAHFQLHGNSITDQIPFAFDSKEWTQFKVYNVRFGFIFNPSRFWIVREEKELDYFHKYLNLFYTKYKDHYKLKLTDFKLKMYCVVFTENAYYRGILNTISLPGTSATVFLIDFGYTSKVDLNDIYFMPKRMYTVQQFAVRGCLAGYCPASSLKWTVEQTTKFSQMVDNKLLLAQVRNTEPETKTVFLWFKEPNKPEDLMDQLVREGIAKKLTTKDLKAYTESKKKNISKIKENKKISFLFPTFTALENAQFPENLISFGMIKLASKCGAMYDFF